ncbi:winged helix-turn-helix domain-containing protein [Enterobacteriaceae bacterium EKM102V]|uniref:winged helix-turn-helix domain-containing protein n=1 Tax=Pantoea TaxID=53335 RepID=UPI00142E1A52|nr:MULTISPECIES: winged helix-turn-helix domain-containing protein [Pantoea]KAF6655539.1 winged helix-turn-helix domain-containing protein [Enterobacteriaceae bacterium EKM102V]KAF6664924.1 winged helix-turn-helix domain-containing protein [Pantoea sp. EKM103V]
MHNHYIINGFIEFHPAASTLRNLNDPEKCVVLNSPAGRCLLLLITRNDTIITQQEFMEIVWEKNGMLVSPNTFYQNISILRKGLKKVGLAEDPVVTIPRVGLTLASGTDIKKRSSETHVDGSQENTHSRDEDTFAEEPYDEMSLPSSADTEQGEPLVAQAARQESGALLKSFLPAVLLWTMSLVALILLMVILKTNSASDAPRVHFDEYPFLADINGCRVYIADKDARSEEKKKTLSLVEKLKSSCSHYPWVYVTHYALLPRTSVIRCNKPMSQKNQCISEYHFRGLNPGD